MKTKIQIKSFFGKVLFELEKENNSIKDTLIEAVNKGAYLGVANLGGAYLEGANLESANLGGANLGGAKNYITNHDFFIEILRRCDRDKLTQKEWMMAGLISIKRLCWGTIRNKFDKSALSLFKKLADLGFDEWYNYYKVTFNY